MSTPEICPACGGARMILPKPVQGRSIYQCAVCGLQWWDFSSVNVDQIYTGEYFSGTSGQGYDDYYALGPAIQRTTRYRLHRIAAVLGLTAGRILDVGCGPGFSVRAAKDAGWSAVGLELSQDACRYGREVLGVDMHQGSITDGVAVGGPFDVVTLWDVIEHIEDPAGAVEAVKQVVRPGGGVVLTTGNVESTVARLSGERWHLYTFPEHLFFHTPASLTYLLERQGFSVRSIDHAPMFTSLRYLYERLSKTLLGGRGRRWAPRIPELMLPVNLWDIMTVFATAD